MPRKPPRKAKSKAPAKKTQPAAVQPSNVESESPANMTALTKEIAVADPRFGFGFGASGFFVHVNYNPDELITRHGLKIYSKMRQDDQVKSSLRVKKLATVASGLEIVIEDKERVDDKKLDEQKRFIEFCLGEMEGTIESYLLNALTALDYGYSVTEPTYKEIDYGEFKGKFGWKALKVRRPDQIEFETDAFGNLTEYGVIQGNQKLPANRFAIYSYQKEFSNFYGESDLRAVYRPWFVKDTLIKFMGMCMERFGMPITVAKSETTLSDTDKALLLQIMQNIQARTGIIIPSTVELTFESPGTGAHAAYPPIFKQLDQWISMAILVPSLIGAGGGSESVGSNARSETEFDTFLLVCEQLRKDLAEFINDRIIKVLIDINYTVEDGFYPKAKFKELTHERKMELLDRFEKALTAQAITKTADDEEFYRDMAGLPELPEGEIAVGTREDKERAMQDQLDAAGKMAKVAPAVPPAPSKNDKGPERNPFAQKPPAKFAQRDELPRAPGSHLFAGQNDAPRDFDEKCLNGMIKRGNALGYDEEALNFAAGFMSAPASKYQSLNEMAARGKALKMDERTIEFAIGFLCESLDAEKREKAKKAYHLAGTDHDHDQEDHGNRGGELADVAIKKGGFTYNPVRMKGRRPPKNGFALSVAKNTEKVIDLKAERERVKTQLKSYVKQHWDKIKAEGNFLGGWIDNGKLYLDISNVIKDKNEAIEKARKADQLAIFDLGKGETIEIKKAA